MNMLTGLAIKSRTASFPWRQFSDDPHAYIPKNSLPRLDNDERWTDPSHLPVKILERSIEFF